MNHRIRQTAWFILAAILAGTTLASCSGPKKKELNRRITLWRKDKIPYGTELAYDGLSQLFPDATITVNKKSPTSLFAGEEKKAYIIIVPWFYPKPSEITALMNLVGEGNHIFISAHFVSDSLLHLLGLKAGFGNGQQYEPDTLQLGLYDHTTDDFRYFSYPGDSYDNWFTSVDSQYATIMGRDHRNRPDFVRYTYKGGGSICLQLAPLAFSNFFLLHKDNRAYYENALSNVPNTVGTVLWDDYFRYHRADDSDGFSAFQYIFSSPPFRLAFWLLLILFGLIYLFDSKRRQRMIPLIAPLRNTSVDFVRTISRLYFQRRDNLNLASKMVAHFQDKVRTKYRMSPTTLDEAFAEQLAYRTGFSKEELKQLVYYMRTLPDKAYIPDEELLEFHQQLDAFYKSV